MFSRNHEIAEVLERLRAERPLVHCLTNGVVKNFTANALLALGAAPAMVEHPTEAAEFAPIASALLINLGTLDELQRESMPKAIEAANRAGTPWVLDPVAVGPLSVRTAFARGLLEQRPTVIRGNASEIIALSGATARSRGTDSGDDSASARDAATTLATRHAGAVLVTGEVDYLTDGGPVLSCANGHPLLTRVTGVGCAQGAIVAACVACAPSPLVGSLTAAALLGLAGEIAAERAPRPGSFQIALLDALDELTPSMLAERARLG